MPSFSTDSSLAPSSVMDNLPTELLANIFNHLSENDILNLPSHIISNALTDAQAQTLLQTMKVWLYKSSLERLGRISRHSNLARHVRELRFCNERLDVISPQEYLRSYWITHHLSTHPGPPENLTLRNYRKLALRPPPGDCSVAAKFARYKTQLKEQERMEEQGEDVRRLKNIFRLLPNLETLSIDNYINEYCKTGLKDLLDDAWCFGVEQDPLEQCGSHLLEVLLKAMSTSGEKISSFKVLYDARPICYSRGMNIMNFPALFTKLPPNTISSAVKSLRSLKLKSVYYDVHEIEFHDAVREERCGYYWNDDFDGGEEYCTTRTIAEMLSSAHLLEHLTLKFADDYRNQRQQLLTPYIPLHSMRGSNTLQNLKRLSLSGFKTRQDQLVRFLLKVAGTVTYVHMDSVVLDHGSWMLAFSKLRGRFTHLESFKVGWGELYETGLGVEEMGADMLAFRLEACNVSVYEVDLRYHRNDSLLGWFRDGTGSNPISPSLMPQMTLRRF
ncbi:MAG: hypothetical protein ASARMPREDX12_003379 [Alectoria sarmentosa]|nr:MAG: hypothetical protein ASARMPREDX12_003379 [Alectoria sarmentosa]